MPLCFGNSFEMQLAFHPGPTSYMQWSNTLSNLALWSARLWRVQTCLIPWKCFSVCLHLHVSYRLISQPTLQPESAPNCSCTGSYSMGRAFLFLYPSLPTASQDQEKNRVFGERFAMALAQFKSSRPRLCEQYLRKTLPLSVSFFTVKCTLDWQPLAPEGEMPCWKSILWQ